MQTTEEALKRIEAKLDTIILLLASRVIDGKNLGDEPQARKIEALGNLGLETGLIAQILGTTPGSVRKAISRARKKAEEKD